MKKIIVGIEPNSSYAFNPSLNQIILNLPSFIGQENLLLIVDVSTGVMLYNFADSNFGASISNNIITLNYDCSLLNALDDLQITLDVPEDIDMSSDETQPTSDDTFLEASEQFPISITPSIVGQKDVSSAMPVALANQQIFDLQGPMISLLNPVAGTNLAVQDCLQYRSVAVQIDTGAGISAGVVSFEGSNGLDSSVSWAALTLFDVTASTPAGVTSLTLAASTNKYYVGPINFRYFRIRVSTTVAGGLVSCLPIYRMTPFSPQLFSGYQGINVVQLAGTGPVTAGVNGTQAVGGNIATGLAQTANPLVAGAVDYGSLTRRILSDSQGHQIQVGPDPTRVAGTSPVKFKEADSDLAHWNNTELLEMILRELKLANFYLKELPLMLGQPNGYFQEEITSFSDNVDKNI